MRFLFGALVLVAVLGCSDTTPRPDAGALDGSTPDASTLDGSALDGSACGPMPTTNGLPACRDGCSYQCGHQCGDICMVHGCMECRDGSWGTIAMDCDPFCSVPDAGSPDAARFGTCVKACSEPADCCPSGLSGCPGTSYPTNYACGEGGCVAPQCAGDSDCITAGLPAGSGCMSSGGSQICAMECAGESDCSPPTTCTGIDDLGRKYCVLSQTGCQLDEECGGLGRCREGACTCAGDTECQNPAASKCAL